MTLSDSLRTRLVTRGWASFSLGNEGISRLPDIMLRVASALGTIIVGRGKCQIEILSPRDQAHARINSLSSRFGFGPLPLHCDTAHWIIPCRHVVLACVAKGNVETPTLLLDTHDLSFSAEEMLMVRSATFFVKNGRRSFYANLIDRERAFVRVDPGCMEPVTDSGVDALKLYQLERNQHRVFEFAWEAGYILVIDNWRVLHGRGNNEAADPRRCLMRVYVQ